MNGMFRSGPPRSWDMVQEVLCICRCGFSKSVECLNHLLSLGGEGRRVCGLVVVCVVNGREKWWWADGWVRCCTCNSEVCLWTQKVRDELRHCASAWLQT